MSNYTIGKLTLPVGDGYRANDDAWATGRAWNDFGEVDRFDAVLSQRCSGGRTEKLIPAICDSRSPTCAQWLDTIGSSTPTTADMEQQVLERVIRPGEILG